MTDASFNIGGQLFRARGKVNVVTGWKLLFQKDHQNEQSEDTSDNDADMVLPPLNKGDNCIVNGAAVEDKNQSTTPVYRGNVDCCDEKCCQFCQRPEAEKVLRDNAGLGTEATRAGVLETLFSVITWRKRQTYPRHVAGQELITALPETLTSPGMTALWEQALDDIAQGKCRWIPLCRNSCSGPAIWLTKGGVIQ